MGSMASYEAAYFGVPSFLMCPTLRPGGCNHDWFEDLVGVGYVIKKEATFLNLYDWVTEVSRLAPHLGNINNYESWETAVAILLETP
jgi:hypothetical protein